MKMINGTDLKYLGYLGCSPNKTVLRNYVERSLAGEINSTRRQTRMAFVYMSNDGPKNLEYAVDYFAKNFDTIYK